MRCFECGREAEIECQVVVEYIDGESILRRVTWPVCPSCEGITREYWGDHWEGKLVTATTVPLLTPANRRTP